VNERRALQRLAGHPVLTELLGEGQFFVGGTHHQYIVVERAQGLIIGELVLELNKSGDRMPELEMLVVIDALLDLLHTAHAREIIYNDVDAKHLFWDRETYTLKVIDWGNAVFLDGDEATPQGISRLTDVFQVGELLYFIVTGGRRAEVPRDVADEFRIDFGEDSRRVHSRLQEIISRALHPVTRLRYPSITSLRTDLTAHRAPLERERNAAVVTVAERMRRDDLSMSDLRTLRTMMEPVIKQDPGYPPAREAYNGIVDRLRDLSVEADLDAVRIYMQNCRWSRAQELLHDLRSRAGTRTGGLMDLLSDMAAILEENQIETLPDPIMLCVTQLFDGMAGTAAETLLDDVNDPRQRALQWQLAERISSHIPEVLLLRPNLYRIHTAMEQLAANGYTVTELSTILAQIDHTLDDLAGSGLNLAVLRDGYRSVVEQLSALNPLLQTFAAQHQLSTRQVPLNAIERALNAAMALADGMHVIGKQAVSSPRDALNALDSSRMIDPSSMIWGDLEELLDRLYDRLQNCQTYIPAADGGDLQEWLESTRDRLRPFQERLFDEALATSLRSVDSATRAWQTYQETVLQGNRERAVAALSKASELFVNFSPTLSQWFRQLGTVVEGANYVERHALPGGLGRALADGWAAFDRGRLADAEHLGQQALEIARSESGRLAASRLQDLSRLSREWVERNGVSSDSRTRALLEALSSLFTEEEWQTRRSFETQMPSIETYLKAMTRGLVSSYQTTSTAALRLLFMDYVAQGALDIHDGRLEDGEFWRDAAIKTLADTGERHIAVRTLDEFIVRRRDLIEAGTIFTTLNGKQALPQLQEMRRKLENNVQARLLAPGIQSLRDLEVALRDWSDGDFRAAGLKLDEAIKRIAEAQTSAGLDLSGYRAWLMELMEAAARLVVQAREMRTVIDRRPDQPEEIVMRVLRNQVVVTGQMLGESYAATLRQWSDTYTQFVGIYTSDERRSKRLEKLNELFRAMFIDRHPAYSLYRHWYAVLEAQPEFVAPPTSDPMPRVESSAVPASAYRSADDVVIPDVTVPETRRRALPRPLLFGGVGVIAVALLATVALMLGSGQPPAIAVTITATSATSETEVAVVVQPTELPASATSTSADTAAPSMLVTPTFIPTREPVIVPTSTPSSTATPTLTATPTPVTPTATPTVTHTPTHTLTPVPPTRTPLPEGGLSGRQDLLQVFSRASQLPFNPEMFSPIEGGFRLGTGLQTGGEISYITPPQQLLEEFFGENAAARIRSVEAEMALVTFNPAVLEAENATIFFGLGLESAADGNNIGLQIEAVSNTVINIFELTNNNPRFLRQRAVNAVIVRLRLERDPVNGDIVLYLNDEAIGQPVSFLPPDAPVLPVLFVKDGGVIVNVTGWRIVLR
jgi:tetratricopeptide (TPR) repeat protein